MSWSPRWYRLRTFLLVTWPPCFRQIIQWVASVMLCIMNPANVLILTGRASTIDKLIEVVRSALMSSAQRSSKLFIWNMHQNVAEILNGLIAKATVKARCQPSSPAKIVGDANQLSYHQWTGKSTPAHHFITEKP